MNISEATRDRGIERHRKSYMRSIDGWYFQWPWPLPGFQCHGLSEIEYLKNGQSY